MHDLLRHAQHGRQSLAFNPDLVEDEDGEEKDTDDK